MNKIKNSIKQLAVVLLLLICSTVWAQNEKSVGTRITDKTTNKELTSTAILDLDSSTRGFHMPRMNTTQRDQLAARLMADETLGKETTGMVIFNTSNDCIEYWHASTGKWRSLCGSLPPAKFDFITGCENIKPSGGFTIEGIPAPSWQQGFALDPTKHFLQIEVYVSQIGTYSISADSGNGYFFSAEGQFQAIGNYTIYLKGRGMPKKGHPQSSGEKDKLKFTFNGLPSKKCNAGYDVTIIPAFLKFQINKATYPALGKYYFNEDMSEAAGNKIDLLVNVDVIGTAKITAKNDELGLHFFAEKEFTLDGPKQPVTLLPVAGHVKPLKNDLESYELTFEVSGVPLKDIDVTINEAKASVKVEPTTIAYDATQVNFGSEPLYRGTAINARNTITVPVKVVSPGITKLKLTNAEGVEFVSESQTFVRNKVNPDQTVPVVFKANVNGIQMPSSPTSDFTISAEEGRFEVEGDNVITFNLEVKPVAYTIDCATISSNRSTILLDKEIQDTYTIIVKANVTELGEYELKTTVPVQGITFSSTRDGVKQEFKTLGANDIVLYAEQKTIAPHDRGVTDVSFINNDGNSETLCNATFPVRVGNAPLNILYIRNDRYTDDYVQMLGEYLKNDRYYSETGEHVEVGPKVVKTIAVRTDYSSGYNSEIGVQRRAEIVTELNKGIYNLVIIDGGPIAAVALDAAVHTAIENYINSGKGWFVVSQETDIARYKKLFEGFNRSDLSPESRGFGTMLMKFNGGVDTPMAVIPNVKRETTPVGYAVPTNSHFTMMTKYAYVNNYSIWQSSVEPLTYDLTGSQFEPLTTLKADLSPVEAMTMIHKTKKIVILPMTNDVQYRGLLDHYSYINGEMVTAKFREYNARYDTHYQNSYFLGNLFTTIITDLMK
ncbi:hypothetical protein Q2490_07775 [Myroides odoratimimus]|uniref:hypothetical protein n=1 Tax=Myroides odoratimimus TaxID=76832 RepID=UPI0026E0F0D2|nr:hypothetical protein [Myroides odoratimimus]MDO5857182.1 hypothetical protein [Myroides odoratimimus]